MDFEYAYFDHDSQIWIKTNLSVAVKVVFACGGDLSQHIQ